MGRYGVYYRQILSNPRQYGNQPLVNVPKSTEAPIAIPTADVEQLVDSSSGEFVRKLQVSHEKVSLAPLVPLLCAAVIGGLAYLITDWAALAAIPVWIERFFTSLHLIVNENAEDNLRT